MLWKCCTQYASKFGKLSSFPQHWKRSVFIPTPKKGNAKECSNYNTTVLISHARKIMLKPFKLDFSSMWTEKFQVNKLGLEKAEEPEIKLPTLFGSWRKQRSSRKTSTSASLTTLKLLAMWITANCEKFLEMGITDYLTCLSRNLYAGQEATVRTGHGTTDWFKIGKRIRQDCTLSSCFLTYMQSLSGEILDSINYNLESRLPGEI